MKKSELNLSFEDIVAHLPAQIYWLDRNNVYLGCNDLQAKSAGLKNRDEIVGKTNYDMPWRDQADALNAINNKVMDIGQEYSVEEIATQADGKELIFLSKKVPLFDDQGNIVGILGVSFDITKQKKDEKKLIEDKEKTDLALENIIAHLPGHVYWLDRNNVLLGCNDLQAKSAGLKNRHEIVGKTNYDMPWRDQADALNTVNNEVMRTGKEYSVEEVAKQADGTELVFISKKVPLLDSKSNIVGVLGISFDITKQKEAEKELIEAKEKAEAANNAKTEFLENMRHDLRTPLSGIVGLSELLNSEDDKTKVQEFTTSLINASNELLHFLNEVLESINVASGEIPLLRKNFNIRETLESVVALHHPIALEKQLTLRLHIDEKIPKNLIGDSVRIYRIMLELIVNALKFTNNGHVNVFAKLGKKEEENVVVKILVEDTGIGIPVEQQQDLFVHFKRFTPSYEGIYKGAGLGLSIVKEFLKDIKGEIYVDSQLNKGAKFVCIIPLKEPLLEEDPFKDSIMPVDTKNKIRINGLKQNKQIIKRYVLVVEDHPIAALAAKSLLLAQGCDVDIAEDGKTAIKLAQLHQYDFILMDIGLPDIDGYEVTKNIRLFELNSKHRNFIIGLTGHVDAGKKQLGLGSGMNVILTKPLTQEMAVNLLSNFIPNNPASERAANNMASNQDEAGVNPTSSTKILNEQGIIVENILQMFIKGLPDEELKLEHAYSIQDWKTIEDIVHKLRGSCGYCGSATTEFKEICDQLIEYAIKGDFESRKSFYRKLIEEIQALKGSNK